MHIHSMHTVDEKKQYFFKFVTSKNISFISMIKKKKKFLKILQKVREPSNVFMEQ